MVRQLTDKVLLEHRIKVDVTTPGVSKTSRSKRRSVPKRSSSRDEQDGRLSRLVHEGIVRPGNALLSRSPVTDQPPRLKGGVSALAALIEERREGR
jgi:hypothetical protein